MNYVEYEDKMLQSFEYETTINSDGNILGICELGKATIELLNENNNYSSFKDSWIKTPQGSFYIYNVEPVQEKVNIKLECYDVKYKLDTLYDSSKHAFPCTLKEWRNSIFDECKVTYDDSDFPNSNLILKKEPSLDSGISNRNVIALIAQAGASFIDTDKDDKFYFRWFSNTMHVVTDWVELTTEKEPTKSINYIILGRGDIEDNYGYPIEKPNNVNEFRIDNNYILDPQDTSTNEDLRKTTIIPIYNRINGLSFIPYTLRTQFVDNKLAINLGDKIKYKDIWGNDLTSYIMSKKIKWLSGDLKESNNYEITLAASEIKESSTSITYSKDKNQEISEISRKTDKNASKIEDLVTKVNGNTTNISKLEITTEKISSTVMQTTKEQNEKISKITQTTDEINSKISDIADITTSGESQQASVNLVKVNESEPIAIKVHPINEDISYLYLSDYLYPADDLYLNNRIIRFTNTDTNEVFDYELPDDLLYYDANNYDEFILNYDSQTCSVIKKVRYDKNTNKNVLKASEETVNYDFPTIALTAGNYTVSLPGYSNAYIYVQLMASNIYTTQFAIKIEMNSKISQTKESINLEVSKKVGKNEVISTINQTAEAVTINANKINISGIISAINDNTTTTIDGGKITTNSITADKVTSDIITTKNFSAQSINAENITTGVLNANRIPNISADKITSGTIDASKIAVINLNADNITSGTISADNISGGTISASTIKLKNVTLTSSSSKIGGFTANTYNLKATSTNGNIGIGLNLYGNTPAFYVESKSTDNWSILTYSGLMTSGTIQSSKGICQGSLKKIKKNFEKYENALETINNIDIYKYNLKTENDNHKKHIGLVIGKNYKYSKDVTTNKNDSVDLYSFVSVCCKAIQELNKKVEDLYGKTIYN